MAGEPSPRRRLPSRQRLKHGSDFARLRSQGRRLASGCLVANWIPLSEGGASRLGVVTGRRLGNAVVRNRARRLLRESFRLHQAELRQPVDLILVARASIVGKSRGAVEADYLAVLKQAGMLRPASAGASA